MCNGLDKRSGSGCLTCENYDKASHYCPNFCDVINDTITELKSYKGYWKIRRGCDGCAAYCTCSECGWNELLKYKFCPHCGAKMENGKE